VTVVTADVLVDLFACQGAASAGYAAAGFEVWAVDNDPRQLDRNPYAWHLGDWREGLRCALATGRVAAVHASPPCRPLTAALRAHRARGQHLHGASLIAPVRAVLEATGLPYVIENVAGAAAELVRPVTLCGSMFGLGAVDVDGHPLRLERHRLFESNRDLRAPGPCAHDVTVDVAGVYRGGRRVKVAPGDTPATLAPRDRFSARHERHGGYVPRDVDVQRSLLGAPDWLDADGLAECIPPAYAQHLGAQLLTSPARPDQLQMFGPPA
jgi:DNA (cytosine-5)-methyltransferase 1